MARSNAGTVFAAFLAAVVCSAPGLTAQSITSGELNGHVLDASGQPLARVRVLAASTTSGWQRLVLTPTDGAFRFTQVPPGEYEVLVEMIGYRPVRVIDIPVRPGQSVGVPVTIAAAAPPVLRVDTMSLDIGVMRVVTPGEGRWLGAGVVNDYPDRLRTMSSLAELSSRSDPSMGSEGLPAAMTQTFVDGVPFVPARHPSLPGGGAEALILPRSGLAYMAFPKIQTDMELQGGVGGYTAIGTRSGDKLSSVDVFGGGSTDQLWSAAGFDAVPATRSFWGGARTSVPLQADTARLFLAAEGYQVEVPRLPILSAESAAALPGLEDRASDLGTPWVERIRSVSGTARVDWTLSPTTNLRVGGVLAGLSVGNGLAMRAPAPYGTTPPVDALDLLVSSTLTTDLFKGADLEFRAGFQRSVREYPGAGDEPIPGTRLVDSGAWVGLDPALPARVTRTDFIGGPTVHIPFGEKHNIKVGGQFSIPSFEYQLPSREPGSFAYTSLDAMASGNGVFTQISGPRPASSFTIPAVFAFLQYTWEPVSGLTLTSGVRYDAEFLPDKDLSVNRDWIQASGPTADSVSSRLDKFSSRVGLRWDLTGQGSTVFEIGAGTHYGEMDPAAFSEAIAYGGGVDVRRAVGGVGAWPALPSETAVPVTGKLVTQMSPGVKSPRTRRGYAGLWQLLGESTVLEFSGSVRRTDFLLRRADLNLVPAASGTDPFGRRVFGTLIQEGSLLASDVGSNRRFSPFDRVWALNPDGWSQQRAATVSLDHRVGDWLELFGAYTWSRTEDNWLGAASGRPDAALDPGLDDLTAKPWSEGTSDFDVPHRVAAGLSVRGSAVTLTGTYRFHSAYPFTAGYRAGVDANGDGSALNDVAFVPDDPAVLELAGTWDCLDTALRRFASRNSCRGKGVHALDVRLSVDLLPSRARRLELVVEGFNLLETEVGLRDTALLLVDGSRDLTVDPVTGAVDVPVLVNPDFGKIVTSTSPGRMLRVGIRIAGGVR
ncbi:MAG TPA: TonB-dependent receptor [Longimicrobiales bacterium]|nr:TonB-dependent receptor [Longimicrobiales bacterium]